MQKYLPQGTEVQIVKFYVVIDTNVLVSAMLKWDSVPGNVLTFALDGPIVPVFNEAILNEYREVLRRPKFCLTEQIIDAVVGSITEKGISIDAEHLDIELPDPKDRVFYEVVMEERKTDDAYLVTGNSKHFPVEPFIVTPRQLLDLIAESFS